MHLRRLAMVAIVIALATGCSKTFTGIDLSGTVRTIKIAGTLDNAQGASTILRVRLLLDGNEISNTPLSPAASHIVVFGSRAGDRGRHTLVVVVADQTSSPNNYGVSGLQVTLVDADLFGAGPELARATLGDRMELLSSGEGISYQFGL
jgi:hypothetical protein